MAYVKFKPVVSRFNFYAQTVPEDLPQVAKLILNPNEQILYVFKANRNYGIFTNYRIILIDVKGIRGLRKEITTIFFHAITNIVLIVRNFESVYRVYSSDGHIINFNFFKPIPLSTVYEVYHYTLNQTLKNAGRIGINQP